MKIKSIICSVILLMLMNSNGFCGKKQKEIDRLRIENINKLGKYIEEYKKIKGYYPLGSGKFNLPAVIYLNSNVSEVNYPVHYNNVTIYNFEILINELKFVLGDTVAVRNDPIDEYKKPQKYISKYYCAGNTYMITANLYRSHNLSNHNRFVIPQNHKYNNLSKIKNIGFFPGFMHRYNLGSITNIDGYIFSLSDYRKLEKRNFKFPKINEKLYSAIAERNYQAVKNFINNGVSLNPLHKNFNYVVSPLIFAVRNNDLEMVKILIEAGADVNAFGSYQDNVLIYGLSHEKVNKEIIKILVNSGANINQPNFFGFSPFIGVCVTGDVELVEFFITKGALINQDYFYYENDTFRKGHTPIKAAIKNDQIEIIKILIKNGSYIEKGSLGNEVSPIEYAKKLDKQKIVSLLKNELIRKKGGK